MACPTASSLCYTSCAPQKEEPPWVPSAVLPTQLFGHRHVCHFRSSYWRYHCCGPPGDTQVFLPYASEMLSIVWHALYTNQNHRNIFVWLPTLNMVTRIGNLSSCTYLITSLMMLRVRAQLGISIQSPMGSSMVLSRTITETALISKMLQVRYY